MARLRHRSGSIDVSIDISDVLQELDDDTLKAEYASRFCSGQRLHGGPIDTVDFTETLTDIREMLLRNRPHDAIAHIESLIYPHHVYHARGGELRPLSAEGSA